MAKTSLPTPDTTCSLKGKRFLEYVSPRLRVWNHEGVVGQILSFGAGEGLARGLNWGMMALLPLVLSSTEEYGRVGMLVSFEMLISNMSLMGMDRAVLRFYAQDELPSALLKSILAIWAAFAWVPLATVMVLYMCGRATLFGIPLVPQMLLLSVSAAIYNLTFLCVCIGRVKRNLAVFLRFRLGYAGLKFVSVIWLAVVLGRSISYVAGFAASAIVMLVFIVPLLRQQLEGRADRMRIGHLLLFGWPFVFHILSGNVLSYFSRFFLDTYSSTTDVGVFTFAFTLGSALYVGHGVLSTYFEPRIYSFAGDSVRCEKWLAFYTDACTTLASAGGAGLLSLYPFIASHLHSEYRGILPIISMVMGTVLLTPLYLQGNYRLTAHNRTGYIALISFLSACLSVALNYLLIPSHGLWGAAMALYVSNFFLCTSILVVSLYVSRSAEWQQYSLPGYAVCSFGSLSALFFAHRCDIAIAFLAVLFVAGSGLLLRSLRTIGGHSR